MKRTVLTTLLMLNVVLAAALVWKHIPEHIAEAQIRRPGEYIIIPADVQGGSGGVLFIVDTTTGEMSAVALNEGAKKLEAMPRMNLTEMLNNAAGGKKN